jgi:hypothetical protein
MQPILRRRGVLALGAISSLTLLLGGGSLALVQPGLRDAKLTASGREVFAGAARALLEGVLPAQDASRRTALNGLLDRIDGLVAVLPAHSQAELSQLLALLASAPGRRAFAGLAAPWSDASIGDIGSALQSLRTSALALRNQAYQALHDIVGAAWFSDAGTWTLLAYPGPRDL